MVFKHTRSHFYQVRVFGVRVWGYVLHVFHATTINITGEENNRKSSMLDKCSKWKNGGVKTDRIETYLSRPFMTPSEHEVHVNVDATVVPVHEAVPEEEETGQHGKIQKIRKCLLQQQRQQVCTYTNHWYSHDLPSMFCPLHRQYRWQHISVRHNLQKEGGERVLVCQKEWSSKRSKIYVYKKMQTLVVQLAFICFSPIWIEFTVAAMH